MLKKILNKLNGLHYTQEYLCFANESFLQPLHVYLIDNGKVAKDITKLHSFVGYSPLIIALPSFLLTDASQETMHIGFSRGPLKENVPFPEKDAIAELVLRKIDQQAINENVILFYEGIKGNHRFVSSLHQFFI